MEQIGGGEKAISFQLPATRNQNLSQWQAEAAGRKRKPLDPGYAVDGWLATDRGLTAMRPIDRQDFPPKQLPIHQPSTSWLPCCMCRDAEMMVALQSIPKRGVCLNRRTVSSLQIAALAGFELRVHFALLKSKAILLIKEGIE